MIAYASRTGTRRNLDVLRECGWRLLVSATGVLRHEGFRYAVDNGAWTAHQQGVPFDEHRFRVAVDLLGANADWVAAPDIVMGGHRSLDLSLSWLPALRSSAPVVLIPVQDGVAPSDVADLLGPTVGIFVGGSTEWKEQSAARWGAVCRERSAWCHVGRVNTARRIAICRDAGATSFDGTSASRFSVTCRLLDNARKQCSLWS